jgi:hypothetical protein
MNCISSKETNKNITVKYHFTRSKTNKFINNYSFDEASKEWNKNKVKIINGCYNYINSE